MSKPAARVTIIGAGLAGCEAALQLAARGVRVRVLEQKPVARTPAQTTDELCELVCSNSFRGVALANAVGLLKEEMRRLGSQVMEAAELCRVPAGGALAVDRERFAGEMTRRLAAHPLIEVVPGIVTELPDERPLIVATGPLTGDTLAEDIARRFGETQLAYYDAIAPIVAAESIDWDEVFVASRWEKGETAEEQKAYVNCPMNAAQYKAFVKAVLDARKVEPREFEEAKYFEGCLPIEVMAERGERTLAFGPMKPVGLTDPRTGRWPHAVVQLRKEDEAGTAYNLVGFQTRMAWGDQARVFGMIPGLKNAEFFRFGAVHRNTFLNAPRLLDDRMQVRSGVGEFAEGEPTDLYFAGQITGTEGYVESAAGGLLCGLFVAAKLGGFSVAALPKTTALGGLLQQLSRHPDDYQPSNITFAHIAPWEGARLKKRAKYQAMAERSLDDLAAWASANPRLGLPAQAFAGSDNVRSA